MNTPNTITNKTTIVAIIDDEKPPVIPPKNIVAIVIKNGKRPLQGTKQLVNIAINFSLGESIIFVPTTPAHYSQNPCT